MNDKKAVNLVMFKSDDECETWEPIIPRDVPKFLKEDIHMAALVAGHAVSEKGSNLWYMGDELALH